VAAKCKWPETFIISAEFSAIHTLFMTALFNSRLVQYSSSVPRNCALHNWKSLSSI